MSTTSRAALVPLREVQNARQLLVNNQALEQIGAVAARHLDPTRIARSMLASFRSTPKLAECQPMSLLGSMMTAASLGLEPNTPLGHAYILPFDNNKKTPQGWEKVTEATLIIGYKGFIDLARRSGQVVSIHADVHYSDDELWEYEYGSEMRLRHKPGDREGEPLHAYCYVRLRDEGEAFVVLPWKHIEKTRDSSQGYKAAVGAAKRYNKPINSPWETNLHEMAAKTAVRYLANRGGFPMSTDFARAWEIDGERRDFAGIALDPPRSSDFVPDVAETDDPAPEPEVDEPEHDEDGVVHNDPPPKRQQQIEHQPEDGFTIPDNLRRNKKQPDPVPAQDDVPDHVTDAGDFEADFEAGGR